MTVPVSSGEPIQAQPSSMGLRQVVAKALEGERLSQADALSLASSDLEAKVIQHEADVSSDIAERLAKLGEKIRNLKEHGLQEGVSTRLLIYAGRLIALNIPARRACQTAVVWALSDDIQIQRSMEEVISSKFE